MPSFDQSRKDFSPYGFTCVRWAPTLMPRSDRHNEIELNLLEQGSLTCLLGGQKVTLPAGRLTLFGAGFPHQIIGFEGKAEEMMSFVAQHYAEAITIDKIGRAVACIAFARQC